ncbi:MAG: alpha/beta hydrolase [Chitinophagaceae bacterium]|nr:MAG: alpha/beta hydrolase [Chitinophagaceae bacterium]
MKTHTENNRNGFGSYVEVNGLPMYYEIHGEGSALVLIHGGGSTIETNFGKLIPLLSARHKIIAMELQAHGRTPDREAGLTFEQDADDVAALLKAIGINKANFFGFSNGATTTLQIAIRHPQLVSKMILGSPVAKRSGLYPWFWDFIAGARLDNMPQELQDGYLKLTNDPAGLQQMHDRDVTRMINFTDIPDELVSAIKLPAMIVIGDRDVVRPEYAVALQQQIAGSRLAIIPGTHGEYIGEITTISKDFRETDMIVPIIEKFLEQG